MTYEKRNDTGNGKSPKVLDAHSIVVLVVFITAIVLGAVALGFMFADFLIAMEAHHG